MPLAVTILSQTPYSLILDAPAALAAFANIKRRAGQAQGLCFQMKNINFDGLWTKRQASGLHNRASWRSAQQDRPMGYIKGQASRLYIMAG